MKACLLDKFADKAGVLEVQRAGGKGKQARTRAHLQHQPKMALKARACCCIHTWVGWHQPLVIQQTCMLHATKAKHALPMYQGCLLVCREVGGLSKHDYMDSL